MSGAACLQRIFQRDALRLADGHLQCVNCRMRQLFRTRFTRAAMRRLLDAYCLCAGAAVSATPRKLSNPPLITYCIIQERLLLCTRPVRNYFNFKVQCVL